MKGESEKGGLFRSILGLFIDNWGLKLLSLALAIVIYHSIKSDSSTPRNHNDRTLFQAS